MSPPKKTAPAFNTVAGDNHIKDLRAEARAMMAGGDSDGALGVIRRLEAYIPDTSDIRRRVYNSLMADAITYGALSCIDDLLGKSQTGYASGMAHAAQIDQIDSFSHFVAKAAGEGVELPAIDLETTLMIATEQGSCKVTRALLDMGVDARIHNDRPLENAIKRYRLAGFEMIGLLLENGVPREAAEGLAKKILPENKALPAEIADAAERIAADALKQYSFDKAAVETLRMPDEKLGMTPLHFAARRGVFASVMQRHAAKLTHEDFVSQDSNGTRLIDMLARKHGLGDVFQPPFWTGRRDKAASLLAEIPPAYRKEIDSSAFLRGVDQLTLQQNAKGNRFKLIP